MSKLPRWRIILGRAFYTSFTCPRPHGGAMFCALTVWRSRKLVPLQIGLLSAFLLVLPACWVTSIHSLYEEGKDDDVVADQNLVGTWSVTDQEKCTTTLTVTADGVTYNLRYVASSAACSNREQTFTFQGRLVKLDAYHFLDISPPDKNVCDWCIAKHQIFLVRIGADTLAVTPIDSDWLKAALAAKTVTLSTLPDDTDTLTASSRELKEFCKKFAADKTVFKPESTAIFRRAPVS
jgi:hypothetical protein